MDKIGPDPTDSEKNIEEDKFKAVIFLKQSDKARHRKLLTDMQDSAYVGRDEYQTRLAGAYDLMIRRSGSVNTNLHTNSEGHLSLSVGSLVEVVLVVVYKDQVLPNYKAEKWM